MADIDDLHTALAQVVGAMNARNLDVFSALLHDDIVSFQPSSPVPVEGKAARQQLFQTVSATNESASFTPINPQCRVVGTAGVVWSYFAFLLKRNDGSMTARFVRSTHTFVQSNGQWLLVAEHFSQLPAGT